MQNRILAIETTDIYSTVSLLLDGDIYEESSLEELNHLQSLTSMVDKLLSDNNLSMDQIEALLITNGPGSFTGIRIGLSFAKAISLALNIPVYTQSSLRMLAYQCIGQEGFICPMLDGRKGRIFSALYNSNFQSVLDEDFYDIKEFIELLIEETNNSKVTFIGNGVFPNSDEIRKCHNIVIEDGFLKSSTILKYFKNYLTDMQALDSASIKANYMRRSEAELQRLKR